jgi:transmembrane sensor
MNRATSLPTLTHHEEERICHWFLHGGLEQATDQQRLEFDHWLAESEARQHKADAISGIWNDPEFSAALAAFDTNTFADEQPSPQSSYASSNRYRWPAAIAACLVLATAIVLHLAPSGSRLLRLQTERLQTSQHPLEDGSIVDMSSNTELLVRYERAERHIDLTQGEAKFSVAKNPQRPFIVQTRQAAMKALGTVFNVDQRGSITELTVLEGRVEISPMSGQGQKTVLTAGQRIRVSQRALGVISHLDTDATSDWEHGLLVAENLPLAELIIELNRYSNRHWAAADNVNELTVNGRFNLRDTNKNLVILQALYGLENHPRAVINTDIQTIYLTLPDIDQKANQETDKGMNQG